MWLWLRLTWSWLLLWLRLIWCFCFVWGGKKYNSSSSSLKRGVNRNALELV